MEHCPITNDTLKVDVVDTLEGFRTLEREWNLLVDQYEAANIFLTHQWLVAYCEYFVTDFFGIPRSLRIITVRDGAELIGAAPLLLETIAWRGLPVRQFVLMSHPISNNVRSDFIFSKRREEIVQLIVTHLQRTRHEWDVCVLDSFPEESEALPLLPSACRRVNLLAREPERYWVLHYVPIQDTWEEYLARHSKHSRQHLKREEKQLQRMGTYDIEFLDDPQDVTVGVEIFFDLETKSRKQNKSDYTPLDGRTRAYIRALFLALASINRAVIAVLRVDGRPAAAILAVRYRHILWDLTSNYDPEFETGHPGHMSRKMLLKYACDHGYKQYDMNGYGAHLQRWCTIGRPCYRLYIYSNSVYGRLLYALRESVLPMLRKAAPFLSILASRSQATRSGDRGIES